MQMQKSIFKEQQMANCVGDSKAILQAVGMHMNTELLACSLFFVTCHQTASNLRQALTGCPRYVRCLRNSYHCYSLHELVRLSGGFIYLLKYFFSCPTTNRSLLNPGPLSPSLTVIHYTTLALNVFLFAPKGLFQVQH